MIQKKICMLGGTAVGKTSLVARYVRNMFSDKYLSSIGVKVDKKILNIDATDVSLVLWDIHGDDQFESIRTAYLRGTSGYLLVADGTRKSTLAKALDVKRMVDNAIGDVPFILVLNKADLAEAWDLSAADEEDLQAKYTVVRSSAKTGAGVEEAFTRLTKALMSSALRG
jgi:small GTP-binding protein